MALTEMEFPVDDVDLPSPIVDLLGDADQRIERYRDASGAVPGFVPSDYARVYAALKMVQDSMLAPGNRFLEWGSGFGVATLLAASLNYEASGIEVESELVDEAIALGEDYDLHAEFVCGSLVPQGAGQIFNLVGDVDWLVQGSADGYDELGLDIDDFDLVYAFPWPGEEEAFFQLFDRYASVGALLVTYHGVNDIKIQRKTR